MAAITSADREAAEAMGAAIDEYKTYLDLELAVRDRFSEYSRAAQDEMVRVASGRRRFVWEAWN